MIFDELTEDNFFLYASSNYEYKYCKTIDDFHEDLDRFKYLKRLLTRYHEKNELRERLILNHLIILGNSFGIKPSVKMVFYLVNELQHSALKTFLIYLNFIRDDEYLNIPLDNNIVNKLRDL